MKASPKTPESSLWKWLAKARGEFRERLHITRIENSILRGTPDVEGCLDGSQFWIELKTVARPAKTSTALAIRFEPDQIPWLLKREAAGGRAFILLQVGSRAAARRYLLPVSKVEAWRYPEIYGKGHQSLTEAALSMLVHRGHDSQLTAPQFLGIAVRRHAGSPYRQ